MSRRGARLAVLGGAFDPPHVGHLVVAQDAHERLGVERTLIVPAGRPPHRATAFPATRRLEWMTRLFADDERFRVDDRETRRSGPSWTVDTLEALVDELRPDELWLVMGEDQFAAFGSWHRPDRIRELAGLAVMARPGPGGAEREKTRDEASPEPAARRVPVTRVDLSSTRVRERLAAGLSVRYLVPEAIRREVEAAWTEGPAGASTGAERER